MQKYTEVYWRYCWKYPNLYRLMWKYMKSAGNTDICKIYWYTKVYGNLQKCTKNTNICTYAIDSEMYGDILKYMETLNIRTYFKICVNIRKHTEIYWHVPKSAEIHEISWKIFAYMKAYGDILNYIGNQTLPRSQVGAHVIALELQLLLVSM